MKREFPNLIQRPDGRGALLSGGLVGNRGGLGRPSSEVRARCRGSFADRIHILESIADDVSIAPSDRIKALELLARYGLGTVKLNSLAEEEGATKHGIILLPE